MLSPTREEVKGWLDLVLHIHDEVIEFTGGLEGVRDIGGLEHAVYSILQYRINNPTKIFRHAAKVYQLLATRHYFNDGNKRTSHVIGKTFLFLSDYHFSPKYKEAVNFIIEIGAGKKSVEDIEKWLESNTVKIDKDNMKKLTEEFALRYEEMKSND